MSLGPEHLAYPMRRYGMDHDRYDWSLLSERPPVHWPGGARLAVWLNVNLQFFPLNQSGKPYPVPGGMTMPYPDLRHFSLRDYGNRVGLFRVLRAIDGAGMTPTFSVNAELVDRVPYLAGLLRERGGKLVCQGWNMDTLHHGELGEDDERAIIHRSIETLAKATGCEVDGWLSPARNESANTPDLLAEAGVRYFCDWVNDDMPYAFRTRAGDLIAMPLSLELEDRFVIMNNLHSEDSWVEQVCDAAEFLLVEAERSGSGRILALNLHPWLLGQPHRIARLETVLARLRGLGALWSTNASELCDAWSRALPA